MVSPCQRDVATDRLHSALTKEIKARFLPRLRTSTKMTASAVRVCPSASSCSLRPTLVPFSRIPKCHLKSLVRVLCAVFLTCSATTIGVVFRVLSEPSALPGDSHRCRYWNLCNWNLCTLRDTKRSSSSCAGVWS